MGRILEWCLVELFFPSQTGPWGEKWGKERAHGMCEPQMERMTLLSSGMDQTGPGKMMWIPASTFPLLLHFQQRLGSALAGLPQLPCLSCWRLKRSSEFTLETDPSDVAAPHLPPPFLVF